MSDSVIDKSFNSFILHPFRLKISDPTIIYCVIRKRKRFVDTTSFQKPSTLKHFPDDWSALNNSASFFLLASIRMRFSGAGDLHPRAECGRFVL